MFQPVKSLGQVGLVLILLASFCQQNAQTQTAAVASETSGSIALNAIAKAYDANFIVGNFLNAERKIREALNRYSFKRDLTVQTIGANGEVTGEYIRNSHFVLDEKGRRTERVLLNPPSTIRAMRITRADLQHLEAAQLSGIEVAELTKYSLTFAGTETLGSRLLLAVDVRPLVQPDPNHKSERYFTGRVWLDPNTFQIVKIKGTVEPQGKQRFPVFETWREAVDNTLAFASRAEADAMVHLKKIDVRYRIKVRYYDYLLADSKADAPKSDKPITVVAEKPASQPKTVELAPVVAVTPTAKAASYLPPAPTAKTAPCTANKSAPPVGPYHWPLNEEVKVYFINAMFTPEQRGALLEAMTTWSTANRENGSGVTFRDAGESASRMSCRGCLTVGRREVYKREKRHYAFFMPMEEVEGRLLISAFIDLDFGIKSPKALKGFMTHELAHGLGLWDCTTCKKKQTIMNGFPGVNRDNGLILPSACDLATVKDVYQQELKIAALKLQNRLPIPAATAQVMVSQVSNEKPAFASAATWQRQAETGATASSLPLMGLFARPTSPQSDSLFKGFTVGPVGRGNAFSFNPTGPCKPNSRISFLAPAQTTGEKCGLSDFNFTASYAYRRLS
jgi:hypothetical protein